MCGAQNEDTNKRRNSLPGLTCDVCYVIEVRTDPSPDPSAHTSATTSAVAMFDPRVCLDDDFGDASDMPQMPEFWATDEHDATSQE